MDLEEHENNTGWRPVFHCLPYDRNTALKIIMPLAYFYSPFLANPQTLRAPPAYCSKCKASISAYSSKNKNTKTWVCTFCLTTNPLTLDIGQQSVEEYVESKSGENGIFFIVDLCVSAKELAAIKQTLLKTVAKLPQNIFVGLCCFNRNVFLYDFDNEVPVFTCLNGSQDYSVKQYTKLRDALNIQPTVDPKFVGKIIATRYYVPFQNNNNKLAKAVESLQSDRHLVARDQREKRALGAALQISIGLLAQSTINTRFCLLTGGPCTVGLGKVVNLPLKFTIRSYIDINQGNENTQHIKTATAFYNGLQEILVKGQHTLDIWAYGLDQFGLLQMKAMVSNTGGILAMHQEFDHFIFKTSFEQFYQADEDGLFAFPIATKLTIRVPKEIRINGILGTCKSLKDNSLKTASDMQIGQGATNSWYLGGILSNNALCIIVSISESASSDQRQKTGDIQAITTFKYSDNIQRTRVSTLRLEYIRQNQIIEIGKRFDEQATAVLLARMAAKKAQIEDTIEVKKWVDRILLKFIVRFSHINRADRSSFRLPVTLKHFPQFIYHLRRSNFINPFGAPPDQSIYVKQCLMRENIPNGIAMIQPALLRYTVDDPNPAPVELDIKQLQEDVILLLDSYFNVLVWYGESAYNWKQQGLQEQPDYQYLQSFFANPLQDASEIMYDRIPVSNFYETFKNDGKERYLKSRVNPSKSSKNEEDGNFVSDDAPISLFMQFLVKSVINYNQ